MKTLNSLLAAMLLVSAVAPVCAMEDEVTENVTPEAQPNIFAKAFASAKTGATSAKDSVADFYRFDKEAKAKSFAKYEAKAKSFAKYGVTAAAVAAVVGLGYAAYNFFTSEEEVDEAAPVATTVEVTPEVAPVVVKPAAPVKTRRNNPARNIRRGNRCGKRAASCKTSKSSKPSCKSCKA